MSVTIREYKNTDYQGLMVLLGDVYESTIPQDTLEAKYLSETKSILVAVDDNSRIVGCTFVEIQYDYVRPHKIAFITYVAVDEKCRKQGIGKSLVHAVENICRERECTAIELTSANYRTGAHAFYESLGFTRKKTTVFIKEIQ